MAHGIDHQPPFVAGNKFLRQRQPKANPAALDMVIGDLRLQRIADGCELGGGNPLPVIAHTENNPLIRLNPRHDDNGRPIFRMAQRIGN